MNPHRHSVPFKHTGNSLHHSHCTLSLEGNIQTVCVCVCVCVGVHAVHVCVCLCLRIFKLESYALIIV